MDDKNLLINKDHKHITVLTLNRPENLNTLSRSLQLDIIKTLDDLKQDLDTRVIIFNGSGKIFCGGADLNEKWKPKTMLEAIRYIELGPRLIKSIFNVPQITITAIHGGAYGGGACIAAASDFRFGTLDCRAGFPECRLGMNLSWKILPIITHLIGPTNAKKMVILGENNDAKTLLNWGFFEKLTSEEELMLSTIRFAKKFAALPPITAQMIKKSINHISSALDDAIMHMDSDQWLLTSKTKDFAEGLKSFFEKRQGTYIGD